MSVAHLRVLKSARVLPSGTSAVARTASSSTTFCGATREPVYRTVDEAEESGLDICASCLADFRKQRKLR
jgi:hypothetical protein